MAQEVLGLRDGGVFEKNHSPGDGNDDRDGGMGVLMGGLFSQTQS